MNAAFDWSRLLAALPNLLCLVLLLNTVSFSMRSLTFGPLLLEARRRKVSRHYPLSDLVALMLMLQIAAGAALAIARKPGVQLETLAWNPPLDIYSGASVMIVLLSLTIWWWFDSTWMLNAAGVDSGWTRFVFLAFWTPLAYVSHWLLFFGGCGVLVTLASQGSGIRFTENRVRIDPIAYVGLFVFLCLAAGLFGVILARWWSNRLADTAFAAHMSTFRQRMRELEEERAAESRAQAASMMTTADDLADRSDSDPDSDSEN